jgi:hypothetical protein
MLKCVTIALMFQRVINKAHTVLTGINARQTHIDYGHQTRGIKALLKIAPLYEIQDLAKVYPGSLASQELDDMLKKHGSNKTNWHNYHHLYAFILKRDTPQTILEIGIGSLDPTIPSNVLGASLPGASQRAFKEWCKKAEIYAADVDRAVLFSEERIHTYFVDQTKPESLKALTDQTPPCDVIIDDGLHLPEANFNTIVAFLLQLNNGGYLVVEDILEKYIDLWRLVQQQLPEGYTFDLYKCGPVKVYICVIKKL